MYLCVNEEDKTVILLTNKKITDDYRVINHKNIMIDETNNYNESVPYVFYFLQEYPPRQSYYNFPIYKGDCAVIFFDKEEIRDDFEVKRSCLWSGFFKKYGVKYDNFWEKMNSHFGTEHGICRIHLGDFIRLRLECHQYT